MRSSLLNRRLSLGVPGKKLVHQLEVPHWDHREGFTGVKINKWHPVIVRHGDLGEQVTVLSSLGNYQVVSMVFPPVGLGQVCMLEQGVANAGDHNWSRIIAGTTLHLIFHRKTPSQHCEPCTVASFNAKQATRLVQQQGLLWPKRTKPHATSATEAWRAPMVQSVVNVPPQVAFSHSTGGAQATALDFDMDTDKKEAFHESNRHIMIQCSPVKRHLDQMWQTTKWLQACEESLDEGEINWWLLLLLLTDGSDTATRELSKQLLATWRWIKKVSNTPTCLPAPTVLNIGQFLNECPKEGDRTPWLLAYAHVLQHMDEATDGRMWWPSGVCFTPQISLLVDVFIQETRAELVEADIASCWGQPLMEVPCQKDEGPFTEVISHLDELAQHVPARKAWDELIFLPPSAEPCTPQ